MNARLLGAIGMLAALSTVTVARADKAQTKGPSSWSSQRTSWGDPDLQGVWTNATATPLERPKELEGRPVLTDRERLDLDRQVAQKNSTDNAPPAGNPGSHNEFWRERGPLGQRTSLLVDPADGKLPALTPEGFEPASLAVPRS